MGAVLSVNLFMDNPEEVLLMIDPDFQKEVAIEHVKAICENFGVVYNQEYNLVLEGEELIKGIQEEYNVQIYDIYSSQDKASVAMCRLK